MFIGEYNHSLDDKGRMAVPAKFRTLLKGGGVITRGEDQCLVLYPLDAWKAEAKKLAALSTKQAAKRAYARLKLSGAMEVNFDAQGRIMIPENLRVFSKLEKKTVIAGLYDRVEIWDEAEWERFKSDAEKNSANIAETLAEEELYA
jgi:MraZ protein